MNIRTLLIAAGLATLAGGCTYTPDYDGRGYGPGYPVYRDTDAYGGYFYVQIIYIDGEPWYVDDYRHAHPIPPHLRSHFRNSSWTRSLPPRFGRDDEMRDGYRLSRIVYVNDVPVYVDDDRRARPLPERVRSRFSYQGVVMPRDAGRERGERQPLPQPRYDNEPRPMPPSYGRERERQEPPAYGREREIPPANGRMQQREMPPSNARERERPAPPAYDPHTAPQQPAMPERMREAPQGRPVPQVRPAQPPVRDGRGEPAGRSMEQPSDRGAVKGRAVPQESGRKANDGQRAGGDDAKKDEKGSGRGKGRDDDGQEEGRGSDRRPDE